MLQLCPLLILFPCYPFVCSEPDFLTPPGGFGPHRLPLSIHPPQSWRHISPGPTPRAGPSCGKGPAGLTLHSL